jgi:hypothetical protein
MPEPGLFVFENVLDDVRRGGPTRPGFLRSSLSLLRNLSNHRGPERRDDRCWTALHLIAHPGLALTAAFQTGPRGRRPAATGKPALASRCVRFAPTSRGRCERRDGQCPKRGGATTAMPFIVHPPASLHLDSRQAFVAAVIDQQCDSDLVPLPKTYCCCLPACLFRPPRLSCCRPSSSRTANNGPFRVTSRQHKNQPCPSIAPCLVWDAA